jgi:hypothetical protein
MLPNRSPIHRSRRLLLPRDLIHPLELLLAQILTQHLMPRKVGRVELVDVGGICPTMSVISLLPGSMGHQELQAQLGSSADVSKAYDTIRHEVAKKNAHFTYGRGA